MADFNGARKSSSSIIGFGWFLNIADSTVINRDSNSLKIVMPNNKSLVLQRDGDSPNLYKSALWAAELGENTVNLSRKCGISIIYERGKVKKASYGGGILKFEYRDGRFSGIIENDRTLLEISYSPDGRTVCFNTPDEKDPAIIKLSEVQFQGGVTAIMPTYIQSPFSGNVEISYDFAATDKYVMREKRPNGFECEFAWDPESGQILSQSVGADDKWNYHIENRENKPYIKRTLLSTGEDEIWHKNFALGLEISKTRGGPLIEKSYFAATSLLRSETISDGAGGVTKTLYNYDSKNRLLRKISNGKIVEAFSYEDKLNSVKKYVGGKVLLWTKFYDRLGRIVKVDYPDGKTIRFQYLENGIMKSTLLHNGKAVSAYFDQYNRKLNHLSERK